MKMFILLYLAYCFVWACKATEEQQIRHPVDSSFIRLAMVFIVNYTLCPICISIAAYKGYID